MRATRLLAKLLGPILALTTEQMTSLNFSHPENTPGVTKLWNRGHGASRVDFEVGRAQRESGYQFSIVIVQFDGLSRSTDRLGHASTDGMWRRVLSVLTEDLTATDLCCRLGGDDFMLIVTKTDADCDILVDRLRQRWSHASTTLEDSFEVSVGVATYPEHGTTVGALFEAADEAMYADKERHSIPMIGTQAGAQGSAKLATKIATKVGESLLEAPPLSALSTPRAPSYGQELAIRLSA